MSANPPLSIDAFLAWARINDVSLADVKLQEIESRGFGLVAEKSLNGAASGGDGSSAGKGSTLIQIPSDLVLSAAAIEEYTKVDQNFRQLLQAAGHQSSRQDTLLYLLAQFVLNARGQAMSRSIVPTAWTEYIKFLPREIPIPTMWTEVERALLNGTSLEPALKAKLASLDMEFNQLREASSELSFWNSALWENDTATIQDWVLVDAWFRSRCLELPRAGDAMVPGLDMVNHSHSPAAYYEETDEDDVLLLPRPGVDVAAGDEVTISYGEAKSAAEMLFSYGFIDTNTTTDELVLPLEGLPGDPLAKAKAHVFPGPPSVTLSRAEGKLGWTSSFAYLVVLNEEDGLEFRLLQTTDGARQLKLFWQEEDVTEQPDAFETLIKDHPLQQVFQLRVVSVLHELVSAQLMQIRSGFSHDQLDSLCEAGLLRESCMRAAETLRSKETDILESAVETLETERTHLLTDPHVVAYLGSMEDAQTGQASGEPSNEEPDFS